MSARPMLLGHVDEIPLKINTNSEGMELIAQVNTKHVESGIITRSCSARHENPITRDERPDSVVKDNPDHELVKVSRNDFESAIHLNFKHSHFHHCQQLEAAKCYNALLRPIGLIPFARLDKGMMTSHAHILLIIFIHVVFLSCRDEIAALSCLGVDIVRPINELIYLQRLVSIGVVSIALGDAIKSNLTGVDAAALGCSHFDKDFLPPSEVWPCALGIVILRGRGG
mmetsp:Transcript_22738/g.32489  ORF Transcript_22738/g.32489 Transcript_22738/m.32489 type:complete len:227 (+) Transcript_22738:769-1449(+)